MNFGNIVIMMSRFGSKSGDFAQRGESSDFGFTLWNWIDVDETGNLLFKGKEVLDSLTPLRKVCNFEQ